MKLSKKGSENLLFEYAMELIFAAVVILSAYWFVNEAVSGSGFEKEFYAYDLATLLQEANGLQGNLSLRYDAYSEFDLSFKFEKGKVSVQEEESKAKPFSSSYAYVKELEQEDSFVKGVFINISKEDDKLVEVRG